ncbi:unnamed protein product [Thelazia callipaeda]|uniref:Neur_chan_LBD domain-containing protein n=1 Tax=Thelazia callipaeda TaxID=103827 RepID=A0A0N5D0C1_THECL|nr:unnamed protein product [Thelazia callipaeda]
MNVKQNFQLSSSLVLFIFNSTTAWATETNRKLEDALMKNYNRKHRPVKKESTTMQIQIYLLIGHIEKVDEHEQTMLLHGLIWSSWTDEYLTWDPKKYNNTRRIAIESWKIWQPALSLYNSARGNNWHLHMSGLPASVSSDGKVWASGSFSFHVTCLFDFTNYPYDEQECPIVIADWVYDLSKINLSDPAGNNQLNKPAVKLSYDPLDNTNPKRFVAGWEVKDTWRRQCYWGPTGCKDEPPESQPEWFWSLIEFGIRIKRNAPYFGLTVILPTLITSILTLIVFWIDTMPLAIATTVMNILLQGLYSWELIKNLPPGSGSIPKIGMKNITFPPICFLLLQTYQRCVATEENNTLIRFRITFYGLNLSLTGITFMLHVVVIYLDYILPNNIELPFKDVNICFFYSYRFQLTDITERLKQLSPFKIKGFSFDPQRLLTGDFEDERQVAQGSQQQQLDSIMALDQNPTFSFAFEQNKDGENIALAESSGAEETVAKLRMESHKTRMLEQISRKLETNELGHVAQQLYIIRRLVFFLFLVIYIISLPVCLF